MSTRSAPPHQRFRKDPPGHLLANAPGLRSRAWRILDGAVFTTSRRSVVERKLIGNVALKSHRAVNGPANRAEQMVMVTEINHRADVKRGADIGKVGLILGLMIDLHANEHIGQNLLLQQRSWPEKELRP